MLQLMLDLQKQAENQVANPMDRSRVLASAIAVAIVGSQHLPSSEVDSAELYYTNQLMPLVRRRVDDFNKTLTFDISACLDQVRQLWHLRYAAAYGNLMTMPDAGSNFFNKFTGVDKFVSSDFYAFANQNASAITNLSFFAASILNELAKTGF